MNWLKAQKEKCLEGALSVELFHRTCDEAHDWLIILNTATVPAVDKKGVTRSYMANDLVCVVVGEVNVKAERVVAVMNVPPREGQSPHPPMGLIHTEDLPDAYK